MSNGIIQIDKQVAFHSTIVSIHPDWDGKNARIDVFFVIELKQFAAQIGNAYKGLTPASIPSAGHLFEFQIPWEEDREFSFLDAHSISSSRSLVFDWDFSAKSLEQFRPHNLDYNTADPVPQFWLQEFLEKRLDQEKATAREIVLLDANNNPFRPEPRKAFKIFTTGFVRQDNLDNLCLTVKYSIRRLPSKLQSIPHGALNEMVHLFHWADTDSKCENFVLGVTFPDPAQLNWLQRVLYHPLDMEHRSASRDSYTPARSTEVRHTCNLRNGIRVMGQYITPGTDVSLLVVYQQSRPTANDYLHAMLSVIYFLVLAHYVGEKFVDP